MKGDIPSVRGSEWGILSDFWSLDIAYIIRVDPGVARGLMVCPVYNVWIQSFVS